MPFFSHQIHLYVKPKTCAKLALHACIKGIVLTKLCGHSLMDDDDDYDDDDYYDDDDDYYDDDDDDD